jgi:hypothetical protein
MVLVSGVFTNPEVKTSDLVPEMFTSPVVRTSVLVSVVFSSSVIGTSVLLPVIFTSPVFRLVKTTGTPTEVLITGLVKPQVLTLRF